MWLEHTEGRTRKSRGRGASWWCHRTTSGSMAAPSRAAAALLCCLHDHVQLEIRGLWPHLFPGIALGLWVDSMFGMSVNCWLY